MPISGFLTETNARVSPGSDYQCVQSKHIDGPERDSPGENRTTIWSRLIFVTYRNLSGVNATERKGPAVAAYFSDGTTMPRRMMFWQQMKIKMVGMETRIRAA